MTDFIADQLVYWLVVFSMTAGLYILMAYDNLIKKIVGLNVFQASVFLIYILMAHVENTAPPILSETAVAYSNPLPHVLILTAIVVAVATTALGIAFIIRINRDWNSLDEEELER